TSAVFGALTAVAAGWLGRAVGGPRVGWVTASLAAVTYLLVRDAYFGVNDALLAPLLMLGLVICVRIAQSGQRWDYLVSRAMTVLIPRAATCFMRERSVSALAGPCLSG